MQIVATYEEWTAAVDAEIGRLSAVRPYLSENGKKRLYDMIYLSDLASLCRSATELAQWIDTREGMDKHDVEHLDSTHLRPPISRLKKIAAKEAQEKN